MKATVQYYDVETDRGATKECIRFNYNTRDDSFEFYPWGKDYKMYKSVIVNNPRIHMNYGDGELQISVSGWMATKDYGYAKNVVVIKIENKE